MKQTKIIGIIGPKGSGKSYLASQMFRKENSALVYDVAFDEQFIPYATAVIEASIYKSDNVRLVEKEWERDGDKRVVWRSENLLVGKRGMMYYSDFDPMLKALRGVGGVTLYIDECHQICNPWTTTPEFLRTIRLGRHWGISIVWISQRFATVHRELTANTDEFIFFRLWEPLDLQSISARCGQSTADKVRSLRRVSSDNGKIVPGETLRFNVSEQ